MTVIGYEVIICTSYTMSEGSVMENKKTGKIKRTWNCRGEDLNFSVEWGSQGRLHLEAENWTKTLMVEREVARWLFGGRYWFGSSLSPSWASLVVQMVKTLPAVWETRVRALGWKRYHGWGNGNPFQYSCLENPMDRGAWWATVHGVTKSWEWLSDWHFHFQYHLHGRGNS